MVLKNELACPMVLCYEAAPKKTLEQIWQRTRNDANGPKMTFAN